MRQCLWCSFVLRMATSTERKKEQQHMQQAGPCALPRFLSLAIQGKRLIHNVLDIYWHCAEPGDNFVGRILCGLNPLLQDFNILPAHLTWNCQWKMRSSQWLWKLCLSQFYQHGPIHHNIQLVCCCVCLACKCGEPFWLDQVNCMHTYIPSFQLYSFDVSSQYCWWLEGDGNYRTISHTLQSN